MRAIAYLGRIIGLVLLVAIVIGFVQSCEQKHLLSQHAGIPLVATISVVLAVGLLLPRLAAALEKRGLSVSVFGTAALIALWLGLKLERAPELPYPGYPLESEVVAAHWADMAFALLVLAAVGVVALKRLAFPHR